MSGKNNVNPDHYKVAGRDKPNERMSPQPTAAGRRPRTRGQTRPNFIPGAAPADPTRARGTRGATGRPARTGPARGLASDGRADRSAP